MTCEELLHSAEMLVKHMLKLGMKSGDVVGLYASNTSHVVTVMLASFLCGTPVNSVFPGSDKESLLTISKVTQPKIIFCDVENHENAQSLDKELNLSATIIVMNGTVVGLRNVRELLTSENIQRGDNDFRFPCLDLNGNDTATITCSSGTTGPPKGVLGSHRALLNESVYLTLKDDSILFSFSTLHWVSGLWTLTASLINGCLRIITNQIFTPEYFLQIVQRHKVTHTLGNPTQLAEVALDDDDVLLQKSFASLDSLLVGGAKVPLIVQEKLNSIVSTNRQRPGLAVVYGLTELGGMLSYNGGGYHTERLVGSEGKLLANRNVCIVSKEGALLGPNEPGEICISTPYTWSGYYRNVEATRKALVDNWLHTGDIGYFDDEGFLYICSRDSDVFKSRNCQIYPPTIEDIILTLPGVLEVCVFGIPDLVATNLVACAVVRTDDVHGRNLKAQDVEDCVSVKKDSTYHLNGGVYFLEAIPKTASDKVQRKRVLEQILKMIK